MAIVDPKTRLVAGWAVGSSWNRRLARECFKQVQATYERLDVPLSGTIVHQDQDAVYTSYHWLHRVLIKAGCEVSFSEHGAKGNPWVESVWSRFKQKMNRCWLRLNPRESSGGDRSAVSNLQSESTPFRIELSESN